MLRATAPPARSADPRRLPRPRRHRSLGRHRYRDRPRLRPAVCREARPPRFWPPARGCVWASAPRCPTRAIPRFRPPSRPARRWHRPQSRRAWALVRPISPALRRRSVRGPACPRRPVVGRLPPVCRRSARARAYRPRGVPACLRLVDPACRLHPVAFRRSGRDQGFRRQAPGLDCRLRVVARAAVCRRSVRALGCRRSVRAPACRPPAVRVAREDCRRSVRVRACRPRVVTRAVGSRRSGPVLVYRRSEGARAYRPRAIQVEDCRRSEAVPACPRWVGALVCRPWAEVACPRWGRVPISRRWAEAPEFLRPLPRPVRAPAFRRWARARAACRRSRPAPACRPPPAPRRACPTTASPARRAPAFRRSLPVALAVLRRVVPESHRPAAPLAPTRWSAPHPRGWSHPP